MTNVTKEKDTTAMMKQPKPISKKEKRILIVLIAVLVVAIACVSVFLLYPNLAGKPDWQIMMSLDLSDSTWIKSMVNNRIKPLEKTIDINSSFVYSQDTAYITYAYASSASVEEAKEYYLKQIPGSVDNEAGQIVKMNVTGEKNGDKYDITNYEADMFNAFDTKVIIDGDIAEKIKEKLQAEFPQQVIENIPEFSDIIANEKLGGYVMYNDDELSNYSYAGIPIFSAAYRFSGTKDQLTQAQKAMEANYSDTILFEDADVVYIKDQGCIISLSVTESDLNLLAVITVQIIPKNAETSAS